MWKRYNHNPTNERVIDCSVRAIGTALNKTWEETYCAICATGLMEHNMPSANAVWGKYLQWAGWKATSVPNFCPNCYTVKDFCRDHPKGTYIVALNNHAVCVKDGDHFDTWDSSAEPVLYYWEEEK